MLIGQFSSGGAPRLAQGPKSQAFHFSARVCALCNGSRTQAADQEFDRFHELVVSLLSKGRSPVEAFNLPQYASGSKAYLNVFRYFAKLLCCHVAESCGPRPLEVSEFAITNASRNTVFLHIDADPTYLVQQETLGEHQYAGHGGLIVPVDRKTKDPTSFRSSLTLGAARYIFWVSFEPAVGLALRVLHHDFWKKCEMAYYETLKNPLSDEERHRLEV